MSQLPLLLGVTTLAGSAVLVALAAYQPHDTTSLGIAQIDEYYAVPASTRSVPDATRELSATLNLLRGITARLLRARSLAKIEHLLDVAGNPRRWDAPRILAAKSAAMFAVALFGYVVGIKHGLQTGFFATLAGGALGFVLPDLLIYNTGLKRQTVIQKSLPDAMDMMTICVEAGLGFDAALAQVARNTDGPLANEFARVLNEMQFGRSRSEALKAMSDRATVAELRILASALVQAAELGLPVATVMREQAGDMRLKRRQRAEEKAQKVTVKILFPLIFCLLPALFIVVMGPGVLSIMRSFGGL